MSIIEDTLKTLQDKQDATGVGHNNPVVPPAEGNVSTKQKSRTRPFVMIIIVLIILGLVTYMALERYQEKLNEKQNNLNYEISYQGAEIVPIVETEGIQESIGFNNQLHDSDKDSGPVKQQLPVISAQSPQQTVLGNHVSESLGEDVQGKDLDPVITAGHADSDNQVTESPKQDVRAENPSNVGTAGASESGQAVEVVEVVSTASVDADVLNTRTSKNIDGKPVTNQNLYAANPDSTMKQQTHNILSSEYAEDMKHSDEKPALLMHEEEYSVEKQLNLASHLINIGSYEEAINVLKPAIDHAAGNWNAYLLTGTAYLGLTELDSAETYLDMGLSINSKIPQLWLQRAIVEQQKGNHSFALQILQEAERLAPGIPEVQLNIGYSNDSLGNKRFSAKAYDSFLKLTEGKPEYMIVRHKVIKRLQTLK